MEIQDHRILFVALEGIKNCLRKGNELPAVDGENPFVLRVEASGLLDRIEDLQNHENEQVYHKAQDILSTYFEDLDDNY